MSSEPFCGPYASRVASVLARSNLDQIYSTKFRGLNQTRATLASHILFFYASSVKILPVLLDSTKLCRFSLILFLLSSFTLISKTGRGQTPPAQAKTTTAPVITKVEPPSWWTNLTPEVMVLLSGHNLEATHAACNLPSLVVEHTQATAGGDYLFVWLKIGANLKSGTAVCRVTTPTGIVSFELPMAARSPTLGKFQGLSYDDVIYLIMPDRFANGDPTNDEPAGAIGWHDRSKPSAYHGGDLLGIREHLSYLKELGVTTLLLTPILKNGASEDYHGYDAVDLYSVDPHLGSLADYQELVSAAHKNAMKIFLDLVENHVGPQHPWAAKPPMPNWFHGTAQRHTDSLQRLDGAFYGKPNKQDVREDPFEALVDPHAPPHLWRNLTDGWFFNTLPDLNSENPVVAEYLLQNSLWWAEISGLDGYRLNTFPYVPRRYWASWNATIHRIYPYLTTIGEVYHPDPSVTSFFAGGQKRYDGVDSGLTTPFDYPMYFTLRDVLLRGAPAGRIADTLRHDSLYPHPDTLVTFFANHDVRRFASTEGSSLAKMKLAYGLTLTMRGIPQLYYGDEIGMQGGEDPDNRRDFPGGWPGDARNAFTAAGRTAEQQELFTYVQTLLRLRHEHSAIQGGKLWHLFSDETAYVFLRESEEERVLVAFNNSAESRELSIPVNDTPAKGAVSLSLLLGEANADVAGTEVRMRLPAQSVSIFLLN